MLRVTVEIVSNGGDRVLDVIYVSNVSDLAETSDYLVEWSDSEAGTVTRGDVRRHRRDAGRWRLLARVAQDIADKVGRRT